MFNSPDEGQMMRDQIFNSVMMQTLGALENTTYYYDAMFLLPLEGTSLKNAEGTWNQVVDAKLPEVLDAFQKKAILLDQKTISAKAETIVQVVEKVKEFYGSLITEDDEPAIELLRHYILADIPSGYWRLGEQDYWGDSVAIAKVKDYLAKYDQYKLNGFGIELFSPQQGVGKTMLANILGKNLIQRGEKVLFTTMRDTIGLFNRKELADEKLNRIRTSPVLIIDEVQAGITQAQEVFDWQKNHVRQHKQPATIPVLEHQFENLHIEEPQTTVGDLVERLKDQYVKNQQRKRITELVQLQKNNPLAVPDFLVRSGRELKTVLQKRGEVFGVGDFERVKKLYEQQVLRGPGPSLGWKELDDYFYGIRGLNGVIGAPKTGKSWVLMKMFLNNIIEGRNTELYSLELPADESKMRLLCVAANIPFWKYIYNKLDEEDWKRFNLASEILESSAKFNIRKPPAGKRTIDELVNQSGDAGAELILIDQLQYVEAGTEGINLGSYNNTGMYWNVLNKARDYTDDIPILYAHQFNRSAINSDSMPSMEMAKGSSAIEETATLALGLWANKDMARLGQLEIGVLCARNHGYASWEIQIERKYGCDFHITRRTDLDDE
ncbi:unnamed protein product [Sphagnum balticum]